ncbi:MAG: lysophospholipid acyltransferase family protein [Bacteroidales bacterium]|nr:lysophospholipid acyltransferase family protein [Bacteroidales bacterium]
MKRAGFYIFYVINYLITLLPLRVLYLFSDFFYLFIYYIFKYRREVVAKNLRNSFPDMSDAELKRTERRFYRHLTDLFVETLKLTHISQQEILRRYILKDRTLLDRLYDDGRDVVAVCSHHSNWEWLASVQPSIRQQVLAIYKPLKNKDFDRFIYKLRTKFGSKVSPMQNILRDIVRHRRENIRTVTAFAADQTPPPDEHAYWTTFMNQETGIYKGTEKVAVMMDSAVVFIHTRKVKRGFYEWETRLITEHPKDEEPGFITRKHVAMLEEMIRAQPEYWLWSHRRWKYKRNKNND